ncbi:hypothetical protein I552_7140 [Mycobacterium xenopi 3993]|nr:hypothetical protein I552_7140 [Mycobacterium xenopi 3993]
MRNSDPGPFGGHPSSALDNSCCPPGPAVIPTPNAIEDNTPASNSAENTVTQKSYKSGERLPSGARPNSDKSHVASQVFGHCLRDVCRPVAN